MGASNVIAVDFVRGVVEAAPPPHAHALPDWAEHGVIVRGERSRLPWRRGADRLGALRPGDVVGVAILGVTHEGLVSDRLDGEGRPMIIHSSRRRGCVAEEPFSAVVGGLPHWRVGYYGKKCRACVVEAARARIGEPWDLMEANCQHFTRACHGVGRQSPGLAGAGVVSSALVAAGALALAEVWKGKRR